MSTGFFRAGCWILFLLMANIVEVGLCSPVAEGRLAFSAGDYKLALRLLRPAAEQSDPKAILTIGLMHRDGKGLPKNQREAKRWFQKAYRAASAHPNNADSQYTLGVLYFRELGVPGDFPNLTAMNRRMKNREKALNFFQAAARNGDREAQVRVGDLYVIGDTAPLDYAEALRWYLLAAERGHIRAQNSVGGIYAYRFRDSKNAFGFFQKAARKGFMKAQYNLGLLYENGLGVSKNRGKAKYWYGKAAAQGHDHARKKRGMFLAEDGDYVRAREALSLAEQIAISKRHTKCQKEILVKLGDSARMAGHDKDAAEFFRQAASVLKDKKTVTPPEIDAFSTENHLRPGIRIGTARFARKRRKEYAERKLRTQGKTTQGKIGIHYSFDKAGRMFLIFVEEDSSAHENGLLAGDIVNAIDGKVVRFGKGPEMFHSSLAGTRFTLSIIRAPGDRHTVVVEKRFQGGRNVRPAKKNPGTVIARLGKGLKPKPGFRGMVLVDQHGTPAVPQENDPARYIQTGHKYERLGKPLIALGFFEKALARSRKNRDRKEEALSLRNLGETSERMGSFGKALDYYQQGLAVYKAIGHKRGESWMQGLLSMVYGLIGDTEAAERHAAIGLRMARSFGKKEDETAILQNLGIHYTGLGDYDKALKSLHEAEKSQTSAGSRSPGVLSGIVDVYLEQGRMTDALALLSRMPRDDIRLGRYHLLRKEFGKAKKNFNRLLSKGDQRGWRPVRLACGIGMGLASEGQGRYDDAVRYYKNAFDVNEEARMGLQPGGRLFFLGGRSYNFPHLEIYEGLVRASDRSKGGARKALFYAEFTRGRHFTESIAGKGKRSELHIPKALTERVSKLSGDIALVNKEMGRKYYLEDDPRAVAHKKRLAGLRKDRRNLIEKIRKEFPKNASVWYPDPIHVEYISLEPDEVLVEYEVTGPYSKAFVVKGGRIAASIDIRVTRKELTRLVKKYRAFFEGVQDTSQLARYDPKLGKKIFDMVLRPIIEGRDAQGRPLVRESSKIIIVPDEILGILPFESLVMEVPAKLHMPSGKYGPVPVGVKYVADRFDIAYSQSATALMTQRRLREPTKGEREIFVLADPVFSYADSRAGRAPPAKERTDFVRIRTMGAVALRMGFGGTRRGLGEAREIAGEEGLIFPRLGLTSVLAERLQTRVFAGGTIDIMKGLSAREENVKKKDLSKYRYLVFATHGILDGKVPYIREPALVLGQLGTDKGNDGFLTMSEVMGLKLNADVVALTACSTGLGRNVSGEGVMGLGRAFQYAGAKNVLVSLWSVSEKSATLLVEKFFWHLKNGKSKREAIRLARSDVRREGYNHPFYWAPFILIGE